MKRCLLLCLFCLGLPAPAFAWGPDGHQLVCAMALTQLSPAARTLVDETLAQGRFLDADAGDNFADACLWPDSARRGSRKDSYEQHFVNLPASAERVNLLRDCASLDCLPVGIQRSLVYLGKPSEGDRQHARKAAALRYLGHFLGDLHQPLHVGHGENRGGNDIKVMWRDEATNLHQVWDRKMPADAGLTYPDALAELLPLSEPAAADELRLMDWVQASMRLARSNAYRHPDGTLVANGDEMGDEYLARNMPVMKAQLKRAARRLAVLLNSVADGSMQPQLLLSTSQ